MFEVLVSNNGRQWTKASAIGGDMEATRTYRIEPERRTSDGAKILVHKFPVTLGRRGRVDVTVEPVKGKALLCGAILAAVDAGQ